MLEGGEFLFGIENFLSMVALDPEKTHTFLDKLLEKYQRELEAYLSLVGDYIDIIHFSDDMGTMNGPLMSTEMYRTYFKPRHKALFDLVKKITPRVKISLHCCGGVYPLLPELIEIGLDCINPVQTTCRDMEPDRLKKEFGKDIVLWGGGCDTREILPNGTPEQIKKHVWENLEILAPGGGFVFQQVHNIMANVPPENIMAMFNAVKEYS